MTHPFPYGDTELEHLRSSCPQMRAYIDELESQGFRPERPVEEDAFSTIIRAINDQLISLKAAQTIWNRIMALVGAPTPEAFAAVTPEQLHQCGTTLKKGEYMHSIARMCLEGSLDLEALRDAPDEEVVKTLVGLRGIGLWTAEMLMIHCFERPDIISFGDAAIRRGMCMLHGIDDPKTLTREQFDKLAEPFHPYATVASIYLWHLSKQ